MFVLPLSLPTLSVNSCQNWEVTQFMNFSHPKIFEEELSLSCWTYQRWGGAQRRNQEKLLKFTFCLLFCCWKKEKYPIKIELLVRQMRMKGRGYKARVTIQTLWLPSEDWCISYQTARTRYRLALPVFCKCRRGVHKQTVENKMQNK